MHELAIRPAQPDDLPGITDIYNHYVRHTPITFDLAPFSAEQRRPWLEQFRDQGRHRLLVAANGSSLLGYACTHVFRTKQAYETTVETTVYCAHDARGRGVGTRLYEALFETLRGEDIHCYVAGITLPNDASVALHERFGFSRSGLMREVGRKHERYWDVAWYEKLAP
jgi:phosphinothricin acetyltransferase